VGGRLDQLASGVFPRHEVFGSFLAELTQHRRPTLVVIEDVHWADDASLDLLRFLGRRLGSIHALVIATYRDDEVGPRHPLQLVLGDLATAPAVSRIALPPLSVDAVRKLAAGSDLDTVALHHQTGGNPFFITEVLATSLPGIPATVRDAVLARAARLSAASRAVLDAAAVVGSPIEPWLLTGVAGAPAEAPEECITGGVLRWEGSALVFRHELAREAVLEAIAPPRRIDLHARVLALLRTATSPNPARLAHHAEAAGDPEAVLAYAPVAARRAAALRSHREAAAQYARALRFGDMLPLEERGELLVALSYESYLIDKSSEGIAACETALDIWRQIGDRLREGDTLRRLSRLFWFSGRNTEAKETALAAIELLEVLPVGPELAMAYSNWSQLCMLADDTDNAIAWGQKAISIAERFGETETLAHALLNVGTAGLIDDVDDEQARATCEQSLRLARKQGLADHAARAYANLVSCYGDAYDYRRADEYLAEGIAYCTEHDLDHMRSYLLAWRASAETFKGQWGSAVETARSVLRQPGVSPVSSIVALVALGRVQARRGDAAAWSTLDGALKLAAQTDEIQRLGPVRAARAEAAWIAGDADQTFAEALAVFDLAAHHDLPWLVGELAFWLWRVGSLPAAPPGALLPFALQIEGNWAQAAEHWQALGCPYEAARALADGDEPALRQAHAEFVRLGAAPAAGMVARRLREIGASDIPRGPRPATQANPAHLTPREMEILALIAEGRRNAEIAEHVYLSPRTVAHHVSAILAKLGVQSRTEAVREAARLGITGQDRTSIGPK
jgi:DNA-binding CsgD family transcriptional regulator/tetratricopeptide (TPR) repeat protein